jgi:uncharacterized protein
MRVADVNILVYAHRRDMAQHERCRHWLDLASTSETPLGISTVILAGFVRIVTNGRTFRDPTPLATALAFAEDVRTSPSARIIEPGERHWSIFVDLCRREGATGNLVPDTSLAALAIEHGATLVTADRGFLRFPGLRLENPLEP